MSDLTLIVLFVCITAISAISIVALVVYNRDNLSMKVNHNTRVSELIENNISIETDDRQQKK